MSLTFAFTLGITLLTVAVIAAYDVWTYAQRGYQTTISYMLLSAARERPIVAALIGLVVGILFGHLFWPQQP
jgi:hypothetical protein